MITTLDPIHYHTGVCCEVSIWGRLEIGFQYRDTFVVPDQNQGTANGSEDIGKVALEESFHAFIFHNLCPAVHGAPELEQ